MMNAHRLHAASKRRRNVFLKKIMLVVTALVLVLGISVFYGTSLVVAHDSSYSVAPEKKYYKSIQITSGDTLWNIAENYMPSDMDTREAVYIIKKVNNIDSTVRDGQTILIPEYS